MTETPSEVPSRRSMIKSSLLGISGKEDTGSNVDGRSETNGSPHPPDEQRSPGNDYDSVNEYTRGTRHSHGYGSNSNSPNSASRDMMFLSDVSRDKIFKLEEALADERERGDYFENELMNRTEELKAKLSRRDDEVSSLRASLKSEQEKTLNLSRKCDEQRLAILDLRARMTGHNVDDENEFNFEDLLSDNTLESSAAVTKLDHEYLSDAEMKQLTLEELVALVAKRDSKLWTYETNSRIYKESIKMKDKEIAALKESLIETGTALESTESQLETMKEKIKVTDERATFFSFQVNEYKERLETWLTEANQERTRLHSSLDAAKDQVKKREETIAVLRKSLIESLALLKPLRNQVQTSEQDVRGLKRRLGSTQMYAYDLVDKLEKAERELKTPSAGTVGINRKLNEEDGRDMASVVELQNELQKYEQMFLKKEQDESRLQRDLAKAVHHVQKLDAKLKSLESKQNTQENASKQNTQENARTVSFADVTELLNLEKSLEKKTKTELKKMVKQGHEDLSSKEREARDLSKELEAAAEEVTKLQRELEGTKLEHDAALEDLKSNLFLLEEDLKNSVDELKKKERENNELQCQLVEQAEKGSNLEKELDQIKHQKLKAEQSLFELQTFLDRLRSSPRTKSEIEILEQREELERAQNQLEEERHKLEGERRALASSHTCGIDKKDDSAKGSKVDNTSVSSSSKYSETQQEIIELLEKKSLLLSNKSVLEKECKALEDKKKNLEHSLSTLEEECNAKADINQKQNESQTAIELSAQMKEEKSNLGKEIETLSNKKIEYLRNLHEIQEQLSKAGAKQIADANEESHEKESMRTKLSQILEEKKDLAKNMDLLKLDQKLIISERNHALRRILDDKRLLEKSIREMHEAGQRLRAQLQAPSSQQVGTLTRAYESKIQQLEETIRQLTKEKGELENRLLEEGKECATTNSWLQKMNDERMKLRKEVEVLRAQSHPRRNTKTMERQSQSLHEADIRSTDAKVPLQIEAPALTRSVSNNIKNRIMQLHSNQQASIASVSSMERSKAKEQLDGVEAKIATLESRLVEVGSFYQQLAASREPSDKDDKMKIKEQELQELQRELAKKERELFRTKEVATDALVQVDIMTKKLRNRADKKKSSNKKSFAEKNRSSDRKEEREQSSRGHSLVDRRSATSKRE